MLPLPALAQDNISNRLNRLENEVSTLGRAVYKGDRAGAVGGVINPQANTDAQLRIQQLEVELRDLTGQLEEQVYEIRMLRRAFDKANDDLNLRVGDLENNKPTPSVSTPKIEPKPVEATKTPITIDPKPTTPAPPQLLGTLTTSKAEPSNAASAAAEYERAFSLLKQGQYKAAQAEFETFIATNPNHTLTGNAQYWLGETFYVRGDYEKASRVFAEGFQSNPKGSKAPDNLLKLGIALSAMDKNKEACIALEQIEKEFPAGAAAVLRRSQQERKRLGCE